MIMRLLFAAFAGLLLLSGGAFGVDKIADTPEAVDAYNKGQRLLQASEWSAAGSVFRDLAGRFPQSKNRDLFLYNAGRADYHRGAYAEASATLQKVITQFPESGLRAFAEYFLAGSRYALADVNGAVAGWLDSWRDAGDDRLQKLIVTSLTGALNNASDVSLDRPLFARLSDDKRCLLSRQLLRGVPEAKQAVRRQLMSLCSDTTASSKSTTAKPVIKAEYHVAMLLPFSGGLEAFAQQIMQGAIIGAEELAQKRGILLTLSSYDTKGDPISAARLARQLDSSNVLAAIGPLTSDESAVVSAAIGCGRLPLIIPAATDPGLTSLSKTSFQLAANVELQGIAMADYAAGVFKADSAAIITSTEPNVLPIVRAFTDRFEHLGGKVVAVEYYRTRDRDFGPYLRDLKALFLGLQSDSIYYINAKGDTIDPAGVPVHVDCLFLPGDVAQLRQILPQLKFYGFEAGLLGSDGWGDTLIYRMGDDITRQAVFPSPFIVHENTEQFVTFSAAYQQRLGTKPARLACVGYDAIRLLGDAIVSGATSRSELVASLSKVDNFIGTAGPVRFGAWRENTALPLYRVQSGQALPLEMSSSTSTAK
jgi:branched-chain amino acid transport system substrate-binding protein